MTVQTQNTEKVPTHLVVSKALETPAEFFDIKSATDWCDAQSKTNPGVTYRVYQLRTEIIGVVDIKRNDYSN